MAPVVTFLYLIQISTSKIAYIKANQSPKISYLDHKAAAQYESSGKTGLSDVSQAGVIELLFPLHASKAPFRPCEASVFRSVSTF